ncbi:nucleotide-binding protein [Thermoplasma volcanium]|uniref:nucleotide-binding protein n=1 Tax=Thermoplasma volcanium TaxID=50339 RepID=UPI0000164D1A|nr:nucleotide-binding protein [Thermoplasma volcanium]
MQQKLHCLICGTPIYSGLYCSDCESEMERSRTSDEESFDEWISKTREKNRISSPPEDTIPLDQFNEY